MRLIRKNYSDTSKEELKEFRDWKEAKKKEVRDAELNAARSEVDTTKKGQAVGTLTTISGASALGLNKLTKNLHRKAVKEAAEAGSKIIPGGPRSSKLVKGYGLGAMTAGTAFTAYSTYKRKKAAENLEKVKSKYQNHEAN